MPPGVSFGAPNPSNPSHPPYPARPAGPSGGLPRRALLVGGAAVGLAGALTACSGSNGDGSGQQDQPADGAGLRRRTARASSELLARYDETARLHAALAPVLVPFRDTVVAHLGALGEPDLGQQPGQAGTGRARDEGAEAESEVPAPEVPAPEVPAEETEAVDALIDAEVRTAEDRLAALTDAPPELARLLASLAAAGSVQAQLLGELG